MQSKNFDKHQNESASMASRTSTDNDNRSSFSISVPINWKKCKQKLFNNKHFNKTLLSLKQKAHPCLMFWVVCVPNTHIFTIHTT